LVDNAARRVSDGKAFVSRIDRTARPQSPGRRPQQDPSRHRQQGEHADGTDGSQQNMM
jgi:hypothetical protein